MDGTAAKIRVVDLFCGAGGLSAGFKDAGIEPILAVDHSAPAIDTYRANIGDHAIIESINKGTHLPWAEVIVGGPPCQGFSSAGRRSPGDARNSLVGVFAGLVARHRPKAFVFENVEGFLTSDAGDGVRSLLAPLITAGYRIHLRKINAASFGVAQNRKRVLAIGGLGWTPKFPEPRYAIGTTSASTNPILLPSPSLAAALAGLPAPSHTSPGCPQGHYARPLSSIELRRITSLGLGQTMRDLPETLWHQSYKRRAFRRVQDGTPSTQRGGAPAGIRRLEHDKPSKAITSFARHEFVHPTEDRYLTIRECARIQGFPDSFAFSGSASEQALLIGNAVPPILAHAIASSLCQQLPHTPERQPGALLSFVPSHSRGLSPVLRRVDAKIRREFMP